MNRNVFREHFVIYTGHLVSIISVVKLRNLRWAGRVVRNKGEKKKIKNFNVKSSWEWPNWKTEEMGR
jgi:hypothetical protein